ncbi:hypothetical protein JG687_00014824 [Phytophthora cactorum]|uniref:Secreted peptide n=1 Tax=Phytophthora cactorum TaxID=29920 RepID=A0A8T1TWK2_9STRA|nr:hypothetical protein JG687_00014824 [Phytophthora cactorum]
MFTTNFIFLTFAVCWTSPLETSVGVMLTIPLAGLTDTSAGVPVLMCVACNLAAALLLCFCQTPFFSLPKSHRFPHEIRCGACLIESILLLCFFSRSSGQSSFRIA